MPNPEAVTISCGRNSMKIASPTIGAAFVLGLLSCLPTWKECRSNAECPSNAYCDKGSCFTRSTNGAEPSVEFEWPQANAFLAGTVNVKLRVTPGFTNNLD